MISRNDYSQYEPQYHMPEKQLSIKNIKGQIGKRLDGENQMLDHMLKSVLKEKELERQRHA